MTTDRFLRTLRLVIPVLLCACITTQLTAQIDARYYPFYLDAGYKGDLPMMKKKSMWMKAPYYPPEVIEKALKQPPRLQNNVTSPDGFTIANASPNSIVDQTETWIAVNPKDPNNMVCGSNDSEYNGTRGYRMTAFYTKDGGKTWQRSLLADNSKLGENIGGGQTNFDPGICFDADGNCYYAYGWARLSNTSGVNGDNYVIVAKSTDGGATWTNKPFIYYYEGQIDPPFNDKWLINADNNPTSPYKNNVYIAWTHFGNGSTPTYIAFSRSTDGGNTWNDTPLNLTTGSIQSPQPAVGPNGEVYVSWRAGNANTNSTDAFVRVSNNGGASFSPAVKAMGVQNLGRVNSSTGRNELTDKQNIRINSAPCMDVDRSNASTRGNVYIVQAGIINGQRGCWLTRSSNKGANWSNPIRVDDNSRNNDVIFPAIAVDASNGRISVFYYSSQNSASNVGLDAYLAVSNDAGNTWRRIRLSPNTWELNSQDDISPQGGSGGSYWGDYSGICAINGKSYPCFWMPSTPNGNLSSLDVYVGLIADGPRPVTNASAQITNSTSIRLVWQNPTTTVTGAPIGEYKIIIRRDGNQVQELSQGTSVYDDTGLSDGTSYSYSIFIRSADGNESEIVTINATAGGALKPNSPTMFTAKPDAGGIMLSWVNPSKRRDGTDVTDLHMIRIFNGNSQIDSLPAQGIAGGTVSTKLVNFPLQTFATALNIKAVGKRGTVLTESDATESLFSYSGSPLTSLNVTFDGTTDTVAYTSLAFSNQGGPAPNAQRWGRTSTKAVSGTNSLTDSPTGNSTQSTQNILYLAPFVVQESQPSFTFNHICLLRQSGQQGGYVEISDDFAKTWKSIEKSFYNRSSDSTWATPTTIANANWRETSRTLKQYAGDTVYVRFIARTANIGQDDGWYLDNIRMDGNPNSVEEIDYTTNLDISVSPNPSGESTTLSFFAPPFVKSVRISLYDIIGSKTLDFNAPVSATGEMNIPIDLSTLNNGMYLVRIEANGIAGTTKVVVTK
jgi:hypothetical protein